MEVWSHPLQPPNPPSSRRPIVSPLYPHNHLHPSRRRRIHARVQVSARWQALEKKTERKLPPEEDESLIPKEYSFNPLQASKELRVGNYYLKQRK